MSFIVIRFKLLFFFSLIIAVFFACTKITDTNIGAGLLPPVDGVITKDTVLEIQTKNEGIDTAYVGVSDNHVLGYINDASFGITTASINFQVSSPTYPLSLDTVSSVITIDSVVLCLKNEGIWGDSNQPSAVRVFQMDNENQFTGDSLYRTNKVFEKGNEITELNQAKTFSPNLINDPDTIKQFNEIADNTLRIRLNNSFGKQIIDQTETNSSVYTDDSTFHNFLRGIIVQPEQIGNSLLEINLTDTSTRLTLYYHYPKAAGDGDSATSRRFSVNSSTSASSNTILHNYLAGTISAYVPSNSGTQDDLLFLQTSPGTYARLKIPGLDSLPNSIIQRAEILMNSVPDNTNLETYLTPPNLFVSAYSYDSNARFAIPYDVTFSGGTISNLTSFGVRPIIKSSTTYSYSFDITRYVQGIVTKKDSVYNLIVWAPYNYNLRPTDTVAANTSVVLYPIASPTLNTVGVGRVIIGGGNNSNSNYRMKLHIVYSLVK